MWTAATYKVEYKHVSISDMVRVLSPQRIDFLNM